MNLYLKVFLAMSIPFAAMTGFIIGGDRGTFEGISTGLVVGMAFGALASLILVTIHNRVVGRLPYSDEVKNTSVKQMKSLIVDWDRDTAFDRCTQVLSDFGCRQIQPDRMQGTIIAKSRFDIFAALQAIGMRVIELEPNSCEIQIVSRPKMPTTLLDYGRNLRNVEELAQRLRAMEDQAARE